MTPARTFTRRQFIGGALGAGVVGAAGIALTRRGTSTSAPGQAGPASDTAAGGPLPAGGSNGILVLVGLYGGNDGLNTLIPFENGQYLKERETLGYKPEEVIPLQDGLGLHPNLRGFKGLWDRGQLAIVRGVGYPNPNRSHFRSMDIWQTASPTGRESTGWLGRWLDTTTTDPLRALAVSANLPRALVGTKASGVSVPLGELKLPGLPQLASALKGLGQSWPGEADLSARAARSAADLLHVQSVMNEVRARPATAPDASAGSLVDPANPLAAQLDVVSRSIRGGVPTRVYTVTLNGFDTHANEKGQHANLLAQVDQSVTSFLASLQGSPQAGGVPQTPNVVVMTFSEFGRRVKANASGGTDHGAAAPLFLAGPTVKGGFYGEEPSLTDLDDGDLKFNVDFRSVYATVLDHVLGVDSKDVLGARFPDLGLV